ncbi:MAG: ATP-binding protein [Oscillospiraceae bacterium]|nr:ATP-binding protein [Oscillospiraceae bacterium]
MMTEQRITTGLKYYVSRFQADIGNLKRTINDTLAYFDRSYNQMDEDTRLELKIVLNELLINAVKHGSKSGDSSYVKVIAGMVAEDCALLIVEDDGDGYDTAFLNKPRESAPYSGNLDDIEETGRGIFIVRSLCEDFMVNEKGNKVVINKRLRKAVGVG